MFLSFDQHLVSRWFDGLILEAFVITTACEGMMSDFVSVQYLDSICHQRLIMLGLTPQCLHPTSGYCLLVNVECQAANACPDIESKHPLLQSQGVRIGIGSGCHIHFMG
jgi:hypothetical protein